MATGIRKLHSGKCRARSGGRCNCGAGYEASVYLHRERKKVRKTFKREAEAKSWRANAMVAARRGSLRTERRDVRSLAMALAEMVDGMASGAVRPKGRSAYKPNTVRSYERVVRGYVADSGLGTIKVADVRRRDVQAFADDLLASGLAPGTVSNVLNPVQAFYRRALDRDELAYNPAARIDLPTDADTRPKRIATASEAAALLEALPEGDRPLWATAFYAGLRRGELQALRCGDVDLASSLIRVERGWDQEEGCDRPEVSYQSPHRPAPFDPARLLGRAPAPHKRSGGRPDIRARRGAVFRPNGGPEASDEGLGRRRARADHPP